jgi:hypothetical protein
MPDSPTLLRTLLYRYFFYGWLFRDAQRGNLWERRAAHVHNRHQARWLPTYMRRWSVVALALFALALVAELGLQSPPLSACLYVPSAMAVPFVSVTGVAGCFLTRMGSEASH